MRDEIKVKLNNRLLECLCERDAVQRIIDKLPESNIIDRISWESRKITLETEIEALRESCGSTRLMRRSSDIQQELDDLISLMNDASLRAVHNQIPVDFASQLQWKSWQNRLRDLEKELQETIEYEHSTKGERIMSEWITDRLPEMHEQTSEGEVWVFDEHKEYVIRNCEDIVLGTPWCEIEAPETYVAPKPRYTVAPNAYRNGEWAVEYDKMLIADKIPTKEAAERIAAIYNEVMK